MQTPVLSSADTDGPILIGLKQFVSVVPYHKNVMKQMQYKVTELVKIFKKVPFKQCLVFTNYQARAKSVCHQITSLGYEAIYTIGNQEMDKRMDAIKKLKHFKCRILFTTDLLARGIDAENINLVINFDIPDDSATYLHRIGRAGRYGSRGISINIISQQEIYTFQNLLLSVGGKNFSILKVPDEYPDNIWDINDSKLDRIKASQETREDNTELEKSIIESENGIPIEALPQIGLAETEIQKKKKCNKSANNAPLKKSYDNIDSKISQWKCFQDKSNLCDLKIKISNTPTNLEKLNSSTLFQVNSSLVLKNNLTKTELESIKNLFEIYSHTNKNIQSIQSNAVEVTENMQSISNNFMSKTFESVQNNAIYSLPEITENMQNITSNFTSENISSTENILINLMPKVSENIQNNSSSSLPEIAENAQNISSNPSLKNIQNAQNSENLMSEIAENLQTSLSDCLTGTIDDVKTSSDSSLPNSVEKTKKDHNFSLLKSTGKKIKFADLKKREKKNKYIPLVTNNVSYDNNSFNTNDLNNDHIHSDKNNYNVHKNSESKNVNHSDHAEAKNTSYVPLKETKIDEIPFNYLYSNDSNHVCYGSFNYCEFADNEDSDLESYFRNLRLMTNQIHLQEYYHHMMYD